MRKEEREKKGGGSRSFAEFPTVSLAATNDSRSRCSKKKTHAAFRGPQLSSANSNISPGQSREESRALWRLGLGLGAQRQEKGEEARGERGLKEERAFQDGPSSLSFSTSSSEGSNALTFPFLAQLPSLSRKPTGSFFLYFSLALCTLRVSAEAPGLPEQRPGPRGKGEREAKKRGGGRRTGARSKAKEREPKL